MKIIEKTNTTPGLSKINYISWKINKNINQLNPGVRWFTLVELIIVITILSILATIAFISFRWYTSNSRDGNRLATIKNLESGLELYSLKTSKYPTPENITGTWTIWWEPLVYVWEIGDNISRNINMSKTPKDPLSNNNYVYGTDTNYSYYQIATVLENGVAGGLIPTTYADSSSYQAHVVWNYTYPLRKWTKLYSLPSLIFTWTGNLELNSTWFIVDKWTNTPYKLNTNQTENTQTIEEVLKIITWTWWRTLTWITVDWNTNSWTLAQTFFGTNSIENIDKIWIAYYWVNKYITEIKTSWDAETTPVTPPVCPTWFIHIPGSEGLDSQAKWWCVMKYEASYVTHTAWQSWCYYWEPHTWCWTARWNSNISSKANSAVINYISRDEAQWLCSWYLKDSDWNTISNWKLLTVQLWSKIARDIEQQQINWSSNSVGIWYMSRWYADYNNSSWVSTNNCQTWTSRACSTLSSDPTSNPTSYYSNRAWKLSNNNWIHDFAWNVWEWYYDKHNWNNAWWCWATENIAYSIWGYPLTPSNTTWSNTTYWVGRQCYPWNTLNSDWWSYASLFGGTWIDATSAGVFTSRFSTYFPTTHRNYNIGFRCIAPAQ